jgi:co-chaperonin GroES (HSP10)
MIKLDPENNVVKTPGGLSLYIDTDFEPEKHTVVTGTVEAIPPKLDWKQLPWKTEIEVQVGDRVVMYYMAVMNCMAKEQRRYIREMGRTYIFLKYSNIYAAIRDGQIIPVNGYILAEPIPDPWHEKFKNDALAKGIELVELETKSNKNVVFAKLVHVGKPIELYRDNYLCDDHIDVSQGDEVILKKVRDIPIEYEYHTTLNRKLYRIQRHDILAVL